MQKLFLAEIFFPIENAIWDVIGSFKKGLLIFGKHENFNRLIEDQFAFFMIFVVFNISADEGVRMWKHLCDVFNYWDDLFFEALAFDGEERASEQEIELNGKEKRVLLSCQCLLESSYSF